MLERVVGIRDGGLELEFDLPEDTTAEDRARTWQYPVRVFRTPDGPMQLLNRAELEARVARWLEAAGWTRADCGRWIFTWNAFQIECDPESVIRSVEALDLRSADPREGAPYRDADARGPGTLTKKAAGPDGETFTVTMEVDPDSVRRARAESDVVVGKIMGELVTLNEALEERAQEAVTGIVSITLDTDREGHVWRRTRVTHVQIEAPEGRRETQRATETVERRPR